MVHHSEKKVPEIQDLNKDLEPITILYVDDEPGILEAVQTYLENIANCQVDTAESAPEALEKLQTRRYDAIIADYIMPDLNGIGFLQIIRRDYGDIPFILYTGVEREEVLIEAINNGVNFYLQKGGDTVPQFTELFHIIEQAVQRKRAEIALIESEQRYRSIIENIIDVYYRTDRVGNIIFASPSFLTLHEYNSMMEVIGKPSVQFWKEPNEWYIFFENLEKQGFVRDYEVLLQKKNGESIPVSISSRFYFDGCGEILGIEGIYRDISDRKRAEKELESRNAELTHTNRKLTAALEELTVTKNELYAKNEELKERQQQLNLSHSALKEANKQLNLLSSITRHDILNRIMILNGYLSIIREESNDPAIEEYLNVLDSATNTIKSQIAFTRIYQDLGTQEPHWIPLKSLIGSIFIIPTIECIMEVGEEEIFADPIIGKVFENLHDNTNRHGQHATQIRILTKQEPDGLHIVWEDNGIGIAEKEKELIFERGYGKNTGLGLFLVREILSITGIRILENGVFGEGARFEMIVPNEGWRIDPNR